MSVWGKDLAERYETKKPRKMLSLDGGGIRGVITLEYLVKLENDLRKELNKGQDFRLCDFFDYFGGTSTGAIIAAGLSIGMSSQELLDFYTEKGKAMFDKESLLKRWKSLYESGPLLDMLKSTFGKDDEGDELDMDIRNGAFKSLLLVVTMNRSTDSPWPISNNPLAKYNDLSRNDCNRHIKLYQLVRASTAAPVYFPPEVLVWDEDKPDEGYTFVDGGVTPYNNPAFLMYRMATQQGYRLNWERGEDKLLIVSVGTGAAPSAGGYNNLLDTAKNLPNNLLYTMQVDQDINCRTVGRCTYGAKIDSEIGDMVPKDENGKPLPLTENTNRQFLYVRYNADLSQEGLNKLGLNHIKSEEVRSMDTVKYIKEMREVGQAAAQKQMSLEHLGDFVKKNSEVDA